MKRFRKVSEDDKIVTVDVVKDYIEEVDYTTTMPKEEYILRTSINVLIKFRDTVVIDWDVLWSKIEDYGQMKYEEGMDSIQES